MNFDRFHGRLEDQYDVVEKCPCGQEWGIKRNVPRSDVVFTCPICDGEMCERCQVKVDCDHGPVCRECSRKSAGLVLCADCHAIQDLPECPNCGESATFTQHADTIYGARGLSFDQDWGMDHDYCVWVTCDKCKAETSWDEIAEANSERSAA